MEIPRRLHDFYIKLASVGAGFTLDLPSQYNWIFLQLKVGEKTDLFTIHIHRLLEAATKEPSC